MSSMTFSRTHEELATKEYVRDGFEKMEQYIDNSFVAFEKVVDNKFVAFEKKMDEKFMSWSDAIIKTLREEIKSNTEFILKTLSNK